MKAFRRSLLAIVCVARVAQAHPIHTTLAVLTPTSGGFTVTIRAFADDFSAAVARFAGKRPPGDSSATAGDVLRYVNDRFTVVDARGARIRLTSCGVRRAEELFWLCLRASVPPNGGEPRIGNQMLVELHPDQVNIVQVEVGGARSTLLFTRGSTLAAVPRQLSRGVAPAR